MRTYIAELRILVEIEDEDPAAVAKFLEQEAGKVTKAAREASARHTAVNIGVYEKPSPHR